MIISVDDPKYRQCTKTALGDALLGIYLNKLPGTVNLDTGGGDATLAAGTNATAENITPTTPTIPPASE